LDDEADNSPIEGKQGKSAIQNDVFPSDDISELSGIELGQEDLAQDFNDLQASFEIATIGEPDQAQEQAK
jgi:hypothetical protein